MSRFQEFYQSTYPTDSRGNPFVDNDWGYYTQNLPQAPKDIENRYAHLVGGGIGNLIAAAYLIRDGHMPGKNITLYEAKPVSGGSLDGAGNNEEGFIARGGREMGQHFESFFDIMKDVPAIEMPEPHSVVDEFRKTNEMDPNYNPCRLISDHGTKRLRNPEMGLNKKAQLQIVKLLFANEKDIQYKTISDWFSDDFLQSNFYLMWKSMFAFQDYNSLIEMKRYMHRFMQYMPGFPDMSCLRFSKYNQYTSFVEPLEKFLEGKGVNFVFDTFVEDLELEQNINSIVVTSLECQTPEGHKSIPVQENDVVIVTNGSITSRTVFGDNTTVPDFAKAKQDRPWQLWHNLARKSAKFGRPEVFAKDPDQSTWESISFNFYGGEENPFIAKLHEMTGNDPLSGRTVTGGIITATDSPWLCSLTVNRQPQFPGQEEGLCVAWAYGLNVHERGSVVHKPMVECTGEEILKEFCYHYDLIDQFEEVKKRTKVRLAVMPYITSQFNPRGEGDRPWPVPEGSKNLGFTGQYVETPDDCVFTVEGSCRTSQMAVYKLLDLDRDVRPTWPSQYDVRTMLAAAKAMNDGKLPGEKFLKRLLGNTYYEDLLPR